jgi:hypothetical protein
MDLEAVELDEAPRVDKMLDALARGELPSACCRSMRACPPTEQRLAIPVARAPRDSL